MVPAKQRAVQRQQADLQEEEGALAPVAQKSGADIALLLNRMALAKRFPRDEEKARRQLKLLAPGKTAEWGYAWPVKNKRTNKMDTVEGPSIKCANAVLQVIDNIDQSVTVVESDDAWIFEATIFDLERNTTVRRTYRQRRSQNVGERYDDGRVDDLLFAMGQSKAIRNAVVNYLPELTDFAWEESRKALVDSIKKDRKKFEERIAARLEELHVHPERVVRWIGRGVRSWMPEDIARISGALTAIAEGVTTAAAIWPDEVMADGPPPPAPRKAKREEPPPAEPPADDQTEEA